jgi:hypothetical protein
MIRPLPSPNGTNREQLYILRGGMGGLNPRGMAYDTRGPTPTNRRGLAYDSAKGAAEHDPVEQIVAWAKENLMPQNLHDLSVALLAAAYGAGYPAPGEMAAAADDEPTIDPMQTRGKSPGARVGMDAAASTQGLFRRFPEIARIGRA